MFFSCSLHVYIVNFGLLSGGEVMRWRQGLKDGERSFLVSAWSFRERQLQLDWAISGTGPAWAEVVYTKASGVSLKRTWLAMSLSGTNDSFFGKAEWGRLCPDRTAVFLWATEGQWCFKLWQGENLWTELGKTEVCSLDTTSATQPLAGSDAARGYHGSSNPKQGLAMGWFVQSELATFSESRAG